MSKHTKYLLSLIRKAERVTCKLVDAKEEKIEHIKIENINAEDSFDDNQQVFKLNNGKTITTLELEFANEYLATSSNEIKLGNYVFTLDN